MRRLDIGAFRRSASFFLSLLSCHCEEQGDEDLAAWNSLVRRDDHGEAGSTAGHV